MEGGLSEETVEEAVKQMQVRTELMHVKPLDLELVEMIMAWEGTGQALSCVDIKFCAGV